MRTGIPTSDSWLSSFGKLEEPRDAVEGGGVVLGDWTKEGVVCTLGTTFPMGFEVTGGSEMNQRLFSFEESLGEHMIDYTEQKQKITYEEVKSLT